MISLLVLKNSQMLGVAEGRPFPIEFQEISKTFKFVLAAKDLKI
jgi:hypothetical protein